MPTRTTYLCSLRCVLSRPFCWAFHLREEDALCQIASMEDAKRAVTVPSGGGKKVHFLGTETASSKPTPKVIAMNTDGNKVVEIDLESGEVSASSAGFMTLPSPAVERMQSAR